jgi:3-oxoacyl-[acyl-carrier-protein] synthase III
MSRPFLSHIAYSVGAPTPIETLGEREGLSAEVLAAFRQRGLRDYREDARSLADMCVASALETLSLAELQPADVDSIVIVSSNADAMVEDDDETALFAALYRAGFERGRIIGLTLQACSAVGDALRVAGGLVESGTGDRPVLVVIFGQKQKTSRLGPQANLVFSDGAASCLVSAAAGTFEICAGETVTNTHLAEMGRGGNIAQFQGGLMELRDVTRKVCADAGIEVGDVRAFLGTNAGVGHLQLMAEAAGVPADRIYAEDVPFFSHVHSCDNLISLRNYTERHELAAGDLFLLLGWSPHVFSAAVLRYCG